MNCNNCGEKNNNNSKFCSKCGHSLEVGTIVNADPGRDKALASMIIGIISLLVGAAFLPLPIVGLVLASSYKGKCTEKTVGIVLNTISLIIGILAIIFIIIFFVLFGTAIVNGAFDRVDLGEVITSEMYDKDAWESYDYNRISEIVNYDTSLNGNWKSYVDQDKYFVFDGNEFHYYTNMNDMENNYWAGTYEYKDGQQEMEHLEMNDTFKKLLNKLKIRFDNQFYLITLYPNRIVKNGIEQSTDLDEEDLYRLFIIRNHEDGIEGIMINDVNEESEYYYKVK